MLGTSTLVLALERAAEQRGVGLQLRRRSDEEVPVADSSHRCRIGPEKAAGKLSGGEVMDAVELKGPLIELCGWGASMS
jgi:hypothetical protein